MTWLNPAEKAPVIPLTADMTGPAMACQMPEKIPRNPFFSAFQAFAPDFSMSKNARAMKYTMSKAVSWNQ